MIAIRAASVNRADLLIRFAEAVHEATDGSGADLVVDHVGGPWLAETVRCLAP